MRTKIAEQWNKVSRVGLKPDEGVLEFREVIFLNRLMFVFPIVMTIYIPVELIFNGTSMLLPIILLICLLTLPLLMNRFRLFSLSKYFTFLIGLIFITSAGIYVGQGTYNHMSFISLVLLGVILFKSNAERILVFFIICAFFTIQQVAHKYVPPSVYIAPEVKADFAIIFFFLALLINFLLGYYFIGLNGEYESIIEEQKNSLFNKNKEITDSIAYAKRIQKAILPPDKIVRELLPNSFVFYKPKDIVAGDFYWIESVNRSSDSENKTILIAAADCTGHGVPGAMVSVVCHNALNRAVREFKLTEPNLILDKTRELIVLEFEKSEEEIKDGMDISMVLLSSLPDQKTILHWSGANNPLVIITKNGIQEIKADKQPVGKFLNAKNFTNHELILEPDDTFYLFTDGFADQFGGPFGKKFKYNHLKSLFEKMRDKSMEMQKEILEQNLSEWKGQLEQVDDICIVGVSV